MSTRVKKYRILTKKPNKKISEEYLKSIRRRNKLRTLRLKHEKNLRLQSFSGKITVKNRFTSKLKPNKPFKPKTRKFNLQGYLEKLREKRGNTKGFVSSSLKTSSSSSSVIGTSGSASTVSSASTSSSVKGASTSSSVKGASTSSVKRSSGKGSSGSNANNEDEDVELEIIVFSFNKYLDDSEKTNFTKSFKQTFNDTITIEHKKTLFKNSEYPKYFFEVPVNEEKERLLESFQGLPIKDENGKDNFINYNISGLPNKLDTFYYDYNDHVYLDIFIIKNNKDKIFINFDNIDQYLISIASHNNIITNLNDKQNEKNLKKYFFTSNYNIFKRNYPLYQNKEKKIIIGIAKDNYKDDITFDTHKQIIITKEENLKCKKNNFDVKSIDLNKKKIRYIDKKKVGLEGGNNRCFFNSTIQLIKNIVDINNIVDQEIENKKTSKIEEKNVKILKLLLVILNIKDEDINTNFKNISDNSDKIRDIVFNNHVKQEDSEELLTIILGDFNIFQFCLLKEKYSYDKTFLNKIELIGGGLFSYNIQLTFNKNAIYNSIQELFIKNQKAEYDNLYNMYTIDYKIYHRTINNQLFFVDKKNKYLKLSIKLFNRLGNTTFKTIMKRIDKIGDDICIRQIKTEIIEDIIKMSDEEKNEYKKKSYEESFEGEEIKLISYELISIVCHRGSNFSSGHYVNYSKQIDDDGEVKWFLYDDSSVNHIDDINSIEQSTNNSPYLFLYKRIEEGEEGGEPGVEPDAVKKVEKKGDEEEDEEEDEYGYEIDSNDDYKISSKNIKKLLDEYYSDTPDEKLKNISFQFVEKHNKNNENTVKLIKLEKMLKSIMKEYSGAYGNEPLKDLAVELSEFEKTKKGGG
jgi:hypothetical protein